MYVLLIIYAICNLNDITWGTREVRTKKTAAVIINYFVSHKLTFIRVYLLATITHCGLIVLD